MEGTIHSVNAFKDAIKAEAEELVLKKFPKKMIEIEELLKEKRFGFEYVLEDTELNIPVLRDNVESSGEQPSAKRRKLSEKSSSEDETDDNVIEKQVIYPLGVVHNNCFLEEMVSVVRPQLLEILNDVLALKIGITLLVPKIEDGNNFGVEVQREVLDMANNVEDIIDGRLNRIGIYYKIRGELIAKVAKYPLSQDYRLAIRERDHMFHTTLCISLSLVRNYYACLHDLVLKNLEKIKKPKSDSNEEMLY